MFSHISDIESYKKEILEIVVWIDWYYFSYFTGWNNDLSKEFNKDLGTSSNTIKYSPDLLIDKEKLYKF